MEAQSKRKLRLKRNLYKLSLISFVVVAIWIGFEVYWSYAREEREDIEVINLEPISPNLYVELAQTLGQRQGIPPIDLENFANSLPQTADQIPSLIPDDDNNFTPPPSTPLPEPIPQAPPASPSADTL